MSFALEPTESAAAGVRRIVDEQLESALKELRKADAKTADAAVHSARKRFKRIRALVRLIRQGLGEAVFARENAAFRDAGGSLSEARDAAVLVATLDGLKGEVNVVALRAARRKLVARRKAVKQRVLEAGDGLEAVARAAEEARGRVAAWAIPGDGWPALGPGLKRVYRDARVAYERAEPDGHAELFHEWRKRVKDLWSQSEILEPVWPAVMTALAEEFHALADLLGDGNDLSVLIELLEAEALTRAAPASPVVEVARTKRARLQEEARALGARLFAEKPGAFVKRVGRYWKAWREGVATEVQVEGVGEAPVAAGDAVVDLFTNAGADAPVAGDSVA